MIPFFLNKICLKGGDLKDPLHVETNMLIKARGSSDRMSGQFTVVALTQYSYICLESSVRAVSTSGKWITKLLVNRDPRSYIIHLLSSFLYLLIHYIILNDLNTVLEENS